METVQEKTYENIYYLLWEAAQRYQKFTQFRVIGKSHDDCCSLLIGIIQL